MNRAVTEYGFRQEDLVGKNMLEFVPEHYRPRLLGELAQISQGEPIQREIELVTPKGPRIAEYRSNPIWRAGRAVGVQTTLKDITAWKRAEALLRQSHARLEQLLGQMVDVLAAVVEVRDPYIAGH